MAGGTKIVGGTSDPIKIFANIFISFIGAGILGMPYAFKRAGLLEGILVMTFVAYFAVKAMGLIIECKYKILRMVEGEGKGEMSERAPRSTDKVKNMNGNKYVELKCSDIDEVEESQENNNKNRKRSRSRSTSSESSPTLLSTTSVNYTDIGFAALGVPGRILIEIALLISQIGFCCAYLIFISENLSSTFPSIEKHKWLGLMLPFLFLLTLIKDLSKFAIFSLFAQVSNLLAFMIVYWFDFQHLHLAQVDPKEFSFDGLPYYFSVAIYCFEGAGMILSLEESLSIDVREKFKTYLTNTIIGITILYITFGAAGYLSYGKDTRDIITLNLPNDAGFNFALLVKGCLCVSLFFTYPIMLFPVFSILEKKLSVSGTFYSTCLRLFVVLLTGLVVVKVPNFGELMALVGASCCTLLAFIMPALCHLVLFRDEVDTRSKVLDYTLVILGSLGAIVGTADTIINAKH